MAGSLIVYWSGVGFLGAVSGMVLGIISVHTGWADWVPMRFYSWFVLGFYVLWILLLGFVIFPGIGALGGFFDPYIDWSR